METTMKGNLYKSKLTDKVYFVQKAKYTQGWVKLMCMHFPYTTASMSLRNLEQYYTPIAKEDQ